MGVDTNALLTTAPTIVELMDWADKNYENVNVTPSSVNCMYRLNFMDGEDQRHLTVFVNNEVSRDYEHLYTGDATYVSMGCWGNSEVIARKLVHNFGGWVRPNDCVDEWERPEE